MPPVTRTPEASRLAVRILVAILLIGLMSLSALV
jgi:hypothetical protein